MILTYSGYNIADMTGKYGVSVVPRIVEGPNAIDSIAGTHEPDPLAYKQDIVVRCWPLGQRNMNILLTLMANSVNTPYQTLRYVLGDISITGSYRISVSQADVVLDTSERKFFGGVVITFTQR